MDFGEILDKWEKKNSGTSLLLDDSRGRNVNRTIRQGQRRARLLRQKPDAVIDLHGLTQDEAWTALEAFFEDSRNSGFEKVLIIHGKGNHRSNASLNSLSKNLARAFENEGVLKELSRRFIETCFYAGESGHCSAKEGGSGATWVLLKIGGTGITVPGK